MKKKSIWQAAALLVPMILGMIGFFLLEGKPFLDSLFTCVQLYALGYSDTPPNLWVEAARWMAPLATASGVILAAGAVRRVAKNWVRYLWGDSVAVYGTPEERAVFLEQLGKQGVDGGDKFVVARRYILAGDEEANFRFYQTHQGELKERDVYLKCSSILPQSAAGTKLKLFCPEENAARLFWQQRGMYALSKAHGHHMKIVMLGFGQLGEELLTRGLQNNLFDPGQGLEYHIFGDGEAFRAVHTSLDNISDPVVFHTQPWYTCPELIEEAALVLVLPQPDQLALTQALLCQFRRETVDVFAAESFPIELLAERNRLRLFFWEREACRLELVFSDTLLERAKRINLRYSHIYEGVEETEEQKNKKWSELDGFTRYSNVSAADYHEIRLEMLALMGVLADAGALAPELLEILAELEHIRWCRYHFLNNWCHGQPEGGKRKDPVNRIHADLIPYEKLGDEEKEKDRENIRVFLSIP